MDCEIVAEYPAHMAAKLQSCIFKLVGELFDNFVRKSYACLTLLWDAVSKSYASSANTAAACWCATQNGGKTFCPFSRRSVSEELPRGEMYSIERCLLGTFSFTDHPRPWLKHPLSELISCGYPPQLSAIYCLNLPQYLLRKEPRLVLPLGQSSSCGTLCSPGMVSLVPLVPLVSLVLPLQLSGIYCLYLPPHLL